MTETANCYTNYSTVDSVERNSTAIYFKRTTNFWQLDITNRRIGNGRQDTSEFDSIGLGVEKLRCHENKINKSKGAG